MRIFTDNACTQYSHAGHPERPERITGIVQALRDQKEVPLTWEKPVLPKREILLRAHTEEHLVRLSKNEDFDMDTPFMSGIADFARSSVGAAVDAMRAARKGEHTFSVMRPPGHHATRHRAMGFCYLNNIAIATLEALAAGVAKVALYDFDVHHGNGTEAILIDKPGVCFLSVHQYPCYPGTGTRNVGKNCFNFPVPPRTSRGEYREVLSSALDHLRTFKPDLIGVSAGFDAFARDPLAQQTLEIEDFHWLGQSLRSLGVPVFSVLEGGYSSELPNLALAYVKGLEGR